MSRLVVFLASMLAGPSFDLAVIRGIRQTLAPSNDRQERDFGEVVSPNMHAAGKQHGMQQFRTTATSRWKCAGSPGR